ncbi:hypothetical protein [Adhaeribacter aquaticus]|uniref:hypothetical protein n=1 Tax=Adhaeribacter aquaticus TaxID=299567 RepID=UPI00047A5867|nr:hypothetical protein [Adhaeribacter aquaticus]
MQTALFQTTPFIQHHQRRYDTHTSAVISRIRQLQYWITSLMITDSVTEKDLTIAAIKARSYQYQLQYRKKRLAIAKKILTRFYPFSLN